MQERERRVVTGLVVIMLVFLLGFFIHRSPRFPGSLMGGILGVTGAALMLVPLIYLLIKRIPPLRKAVTKRISMRTLLSYHIYAGIIGPILVLLHTGHKFNSVLGISLTAMTIIVVVSGFVGRYLLTQISSDIKDKRKMLSSLQDSYNQITDELARSPSPPQLLPQFSGVFSKIYYFFFTRSSQVEIWDMTLSRAINITESMADLEYSIKTQELFKSLFSKWLKFHIVIAAVLYVLLAFHIWAGIHFGLRWFE